MVKNNQAGGSGSITSNRRAKEYRQRRAIETRISKSYKKSRGRRRYAVKEYIRREGQQSFSFDEGSKCRGPGSFKRRGRSEIRQIIAGREIADPCEMTLMLGSNTESIKEFLQSATENNFNRLMRCLNCLDIAFKCKMTPGLLLNIIREIQETDFIIKSVEKLTYCIENENLLEKESYCLDTVSVIIRIVIRICSLSPSAFTFMYGCKDVISKLVELIRNSLENMLVLCQGIDTLAEKLSESSGSENEIERKGTGLIDYNTNIDDSQRNSLQNVISENKSDGSFRYLNDNMGEKISESSENENKMERKGSDLIEYSDDHTDIDAIQSNSLQIIISDDTNDLNDSMTEKISEFSGIENNDGRKGSGLIEYSNDYTDIDNIQRNSLQNFDDKSDGNFDDLNESMSERISESSGNENERKGSDHPEQNFIFENKSGRKCHEHDRNNKKLLDINDHDEIPSTSMQYFMTENKTKTKDLNRDECINNCSNDLSDISDSSLQNFISEDKNDVSFDDFRHSLSDNCKLEGFVTDSNNDFSDINYFGESQSSTIQESIYVVKNMQPDPICLENIKTDFTCVERLLHELVNAIKISTSKHRKYKQIDHKKDSDEDFREIPIFPRIGDLNGDIYPNIRINKATGQYNSVDDYLDVQFRLLREDFIDPLRAGILDFKDQKANKNIQKLNDIKVYENTHIISPFCGYGVNYILSFDITKFKRVRWNMSKRLKYGSLVCLTADNFETCYFATIVDSDAKFRRQGRVHVKFDNSLEKEQLLRKKTFTMVESTAYFESYRPVLSSLQTIEESDLPFQEYIIRCCKNKVTPPKYLFRGSAQITMDLRCLLCQQERLGEEEKNIQHMEALNVKIMEEKWRIDDQIPLDSSQLNALKSALTRDFTLIQGPPGCGKTHVGLMITKVLFLNKHKWTQADESSIKILIVCYSNHALDQFMEGMCSFVKNMVRVGGRSSNKKMENLNLKNIKQNFRKDKRFPQYIRHCRSNALSDVIPLKQRINLESQKIKILKENIVHESELYRFMGINHRKQFEMFSNYFRYSRSSPPPWMGDLKDTFIIEWLGIITFAKKVQACSYKERKRIKHVNFEEMIDELFRIDNREALIDINFDTTSLLEDQQKEELELFKVKKLSLDLEQVCCSSLTHLNDTKRQQVAMERNIIMKHIKSKLQNIKPMSKFDALSFDDIMSNDFTYDKRWALYLFWVQENCYDRHQAIKIDLDHFERADKRLREVKMMEDLYVLRNADIIGITITGAAIHKAVLQEIKPAIMIVEEAAEVLESHLVSTLTSGCEQLVMIGDHKQLKPKPNVFRLERDYNLSLSLFERMVRNGIRCDCLRIQHRMRPEIADNVRNFYNSLEDHSSVKQYETIKGVAYNVYFIDHRSEEKRDEELKSYTNKHEAQFLVALCRYLLLQGYKASNITILTTYSGQMFLLKKEILKHGETLKEVRLTIVDNFQGEENDIILLSLVRSNKEGRIGFVAEDNRICVALSRAKKGLFIIGNRNCLQSGNSKWKGIIENMAKNGFVGEALHLYCQNHPEDGGIMTKCSEDFDASPEGGCSKMCEIRLQCGHCCGKHCHIENKEHVNVICSKPCVKRCSNGHQCKKQCFEECKCEENIIVTLPCGHIEQLECSTDIQSYECNNSCQKKLDCGHVCRRKCKDKCICMEPIKVKLKCGHDATIPCSVNPASHKCDARIQVLLTDCGHFESVFCRDTSKSIICNNTCGLLLDCGHLCREQCGGTAQNVVNKASSKCPKGHNFICTSPCTAILKCGHPCKGSCSSCWQGRWHKLCSVECNCLLVCGHTCKGKCGFCLPCAEKCQRRCRHVLCSRNCFESCVPCTKVCTWKCEHFTCTKKCGEECDRPRCKRKCTKLLNCKHRCIGMCGDPCPNLCRVCEKEKMAERVYAKDNNPNAKYVQLQDCKHIIEYKLMDEYMDADDGFCLKRCPICNCGIWNTGGNRYENIVNKIFLRINHIKQVSLQDLELHEILMASASEQSRVIFEGKSISIPDGRPLASSNFDLTEYFKMAQVPSKLFNFLACRDNVNVLNYLSVLRFIKSVAKQNSFIVDDESIFQGASLCFLSKQHIYEVESETKRLLDKCQLKTIQDILVDGEREDWEYVRKAADVLKQKGVYSEESRQKVQGYINQIPGKCKIMKRKLINLSFTDIDIDRNAILKNTFINIDFWQEELPDIHQESLKETNNVEEVEIQSKRREPKICYNDLKDVQDVHGGVPLQNNCLELEDGEIRTPDVKSNHLHCEKNCDSQKTESTIFEGLSFEETEDGEIIDECDSGAQYEVTTERPNETTYIRSTLITFVENERKFLSGEETHQTRSTYNTKSEAISVCKIREEYVGDTAPTEYLDERSYRLKLLRWHGVPYFHNKKPVLQVNDARSQHSKDKGNERRESSIRKRKQTHDLVDKEEPAHKRLKNGKVNFKIQTKTKSQVIAANPYGETGSDMFSDADVFDGSLSVTKNNENVKECKNQGQTIAPIASEPFNRKGNMSAQTSSTSCRKLVEYDDIETYDDYEIPFGSGLNSETITSRTDNQRRVHVVKENDGNILSKSLEASYSEPSIFTSHNQSYDMPLEETESVQASHTSTRDVNIISNDKPSIDGKCDLRTLLNKRKKRNIGLKCRERYDLRFKIKHSASSTNTKPIRKKFERTNRNITDRKRKFSKMKSKGQGSIGDESKEELNCNTEVNFKGDVYEVIDEV